MLVVLEKVFEEFDNIENPLFEVFDLADGSDVVYACDAPNSSKSQTINIHSQTFLSSPIGVVQMRFIVFNKLPIPKPGKISHEARRTGELVEAVR